MPCTVSQPTEHFLTEILNNVNIFMKSKISLKIYQRQASTFQRHLHKDASKPD